MANKINITFPGGLKTAIIDDRHKPYNSCQIGKKNNYETNRLVQNDLSLNMHRKWYTIITAVFIGLLSTPVGKW